MRTATRFFSAKRVVFLGTPSVAAHCLETILNSAEKSNVACGFECVAVVSQPPARVGRQRQVQPSPTHLMADANGIPVFTPVSAKDEAFLQQMNELQPDLCITAAYGQFLPRKFLAIPKYGTLNIHPSLLPKFRGAAPIQRSIQADEGELGVSVAMTVLKMDAGPVVTQWACSDDGTSQAASVELKLVKYIQNFKLPMYCFASLTCVSPSISIPAI
jgi:methionyl-tRNA formyltransferase